MHEEGSQAFYAAKMTNQVEELAILNDSATYNANRHGNSSRERRPGKKMEVAEMRILQSPQGK